MRTLHQLESPYAVDAAGSVEECAVSFASTGGVTLSGTWFTTHARPATAAVVVAGGAGVPAASYRHLARDLAARGAAVLTFDYRGVGSSRREDLRDLVARTEEWVGDVGAALDEARSVYPAAELQAVAHGAGTFLLGAAPAAPQLSRVVLFGPHAGYHGDYLPRWRPVMRLTWHVLMPLVTETLGYFPGRALHLGEDLPRGIALDWARARADVDARLAGTVEHYDRVRAATLALTVTDDAFATEAAGQRVLGHYSGASAIHEIVSPRQLGLAHVGHFGFLERRPGQYFWGRTARWLGLAARAVR